MRRLKNLSHCSDDGGAAAAAVAATALLPALAPLLRCTVRGRRRRLKLCAALRTVQFSLCDCSSRRPRREPPSGAFPSRASSPMCRTARSAACSDGCSPLLIRLRASGAFPCSQSATAAACSDGGANAKTGTKLVSFSIESPLPGKANCTAASKLRSAVC